MAITTTSTENKQIVCRFPEEVIFQRNIGVIDEIFTEDVIDPHGSGETRGRDALTDTTESFHVALAGSTATVEDIVADGDLVAIR